MKNKLSKVLLIISIITIFISSIISIINIFTKLVIPVENKIKMYNELDKQEKQLDNKIIKLQNETTQIQNETDKKINQKNKLEKILFDNNEKIDGKVVYITFDDGPNEYTDEILDILNKYNVKATFFVTCSKDYKSTYKRIVDEGHTIALHTCTHQYKDVYSNEEGYLNDLKNIENLVEQYTGVKSNYVRFPGGSSNVVSREYSIGIMGKLTNLLKDNGYKYYDWNIYSGDVSGFNCEEEYNRVIDLLESSNNNVNMVLMHDTKESTRDSLEKIIKKALDLGYTFSKINENTPEVHHKLNN